jgi:hypothetical protein
MILAFGCSVTHGAELVSPHQDSSNTKHSYPIIIANTLGVEGCNYAECGISNEGIFHKTINVLDECDNKDITAVIVGWTSSVREYWIADNREWYFIPSWCATKHVSKQFKYFKDYTDTDINLHPRLCADEEMYLPALEEMYNYISTYKFDIFEYERKKLNYIDSIRNYCQRRQFKLIETCCLGDVFDIPIKLDNFGTWRQGLGHPTKEDHQQIAQQILLTI